MHLSAKQAVEGNLKGLRDGIEEGGLEARAEAIVPHMVGRIFPQHALDMVGVADSPGVVEEGLSDPHLS